MRIIECCPFFKENLIARIHIEESSKWVDEIHITESSHTLQYKEKPYCFEHAYLPKVHYNQLNVTKLFLKSRTYFPHVRFFNKPQWHPFVFRNATWFNEGIQRKYFLPEFDDNDILVFSDIDEIINPAFADQIFEEVKKREIITIKLHFTLFYFNLFSTNWGGPEDYSYRVFVMNGRTFRKKWNLDYDTLRKYGERSHLKNEIYCLPEVAGFHHSWLGDEKFISEKLKSYAHTEHSVFDNKEYIENCFRNGKSIFPGHELKLDNSVPLLESIEKNRKVYKQYLM